ncbi:hypothetical protein L1987_69274 [Smallanthus sonchifolius]|uniref:Uncharacterized protein n=1 Tax=Smallanthus sonchifolius TaxID=185202 RepID=A0ACB9B567_9ASTR|nr:hypothetical protein L1987_69274 [Smallanthus sonchifolius]
MKCFSRFTNDESDPIIIENEETDSECEKDHSKFKKQHKEKMNKEAGEEDDMLIKNLSKGKKQKVLKKEDDGKRSGKKIETSKKGKGKEKVEEGFQIKVDSGKKRKEQEQGHGEVKITNCKKRKTSTSETMQQHIPFTGKKLLLRCAPGNLINLLHNLTKSQRKVVEEIGFGKTLLLKLHTIPASLGYWLLQNYDPSTDILNDGANEYKLTTSLINEIFGIPNGETQVTQMSKPKTYDPVVKEWRSQFDDEMQKKQKKISVSDLVDYLKKTDDSGRMFKLNFMVVLMSIIGETMKSNTVRMERIEKELKKIENHAEKLRMLFEKERKDYPSSNIVKEKQKEWELLLKKYIPVEEFSKETPRIQSTDIVLLDTPLIVSQDTMLELIELEKQATKRIEEVENQKKKSESVNKNDPPSFHLLSQDSNEGNPEIEIGNTENVEKETIGEKEIVEDMVREKPVGGTEKIGEELVVEKNIGKDMIVEKIVGEETKEDEINEDTMEAEGDKMGEEKTPTEVEEKKQERPKRKIILSDALCSPYKQRRVGMEEKLTTVEKNISSYLFSGNGYVWDSLFEITDVMTTPRIELETLSPGIEVHVDVINTWAHLLNNEELKRNRDSSVFRLFCTAPMIHRDTFNKGAEERNNEFKKNMTELLKKEKLDNIKEFDLIFFPMILSQHFYLMCFNLKKPEIIIIDNSALGEYNAKYKGIPEKFKEAFVSFIADFAHPKTDEMDDNVVKRFEMPWRTTVNNKDCGIFMMRHMETYMGEEEKAWQCGFGVEPENVQEKQIEDLRRKY